MKKAFLIAISISTALLAGCGQQQENIVKVGIISPLSGPASTYGIDAVNAYTLVVNNYNAQTTWARIQLLVEDGKCDWKASTDAAQKLITVDSIDLLVVASCSSASVAAGKIAQEAKITNIHSLSVAPSISQLGDYVFRYPNGLDVWTKMTDYAKKHWNSITLITEKTEFCKAIKDVIIKQYTGAIIKDLSFEWSEKDFSILAKQVADTNAEGLFVITQSDATSTSVIKALDAEWQVSKYKGKILWFSTFWLPPFLDAIGDLSDWLLQYNYGAMFALPQQGKDFLSAYEKQYKVLSDPWFVVIFGESMQLITKAVAAGNTTSEQIKAYLESITADKSTEWLFGKYHFDANGDVVSIPFHLQQVRKGKPEFIE